MNVRFGTWNMRGSLITVARELAINALDLAGVTAVRTNVGSTEQTDNFRWKGE
jgi:hypothetical protein